MERHCRPVARHLTVSEPLSKNACPSGVVGTPSFGTFFFVYISRYLLLGL